jgi:ribonuclease HII
MQKGLMLHNPNLVAGVDEAGRGPLAGPVVAAVVILNPDLPISGLADSKILSEKRRVALFHEIRNKAFAWSFASATVFEIDQINIFQASLLAMQRAVKRLNCTPSLILIDGKHCPKLDYPMQAIVRGDATEAAISAASIVAKVMRDRMMLRLDKRYPQYGFAQHKGYPTTLHLASLKRFGPSRIHRRSFSPVAKLLDNASVIKFK